MYKNSVRKSINFSAENLHLYHYSGNNPVKYVDPTGTDIKEATLFSASFGVFGAVRSSVGYAKDSNNKNAIFFKLETGVGFGGSVLKVDDFLPALDLISSVLTDVLENIDAIDTFFNDVPDTGKGNFTNEVTKTSENIIQWKKNGKSCPVEAAVIVGAEGDKDGNIKLSFGATAIASVYLREDTVYIDITNGIDYIKQEIRNFLGEN